MASPFLASGGALEGIRVVELATVIAGPSAAMLLCGFGADVIKVESPGRGDSWRYDGLQPGRQPACSLFEQANRGKRSICIDITSKPGIQALYGLIATCDVFITNVRLKSLKKRGLDYETLHSKLPHLVYAHLTGWGRVGPRMHDPGYDIGCFGAGAGVSMYSAQEPHAPIFPAGFGDQMTSTLLVLGIMTALYQRTTSKSGQLVDCSLFRAGVWGMATQVLKSFVYPARLDGKPILDTTQSSPTYTQYCSKDGVWFQLLGLEVTRHLPKMIAAFGVKDGPHVRKHLAAAYAAQGAADLESLMSQHGIWYTRFNTVADLTADGQAQASGVWTTAKGADHKFVANPVKLSNCPEKILSRAPAVGAHTAAILAELSLPQETVAAVLASQQRAKL